MTTPFKPAGYHSITPTFCVDDPKKFIDFLRQVFSAEERLRLSGPDGRIMHAELGIGDSVIMLGSSMPGWPARTNAVYVYVEDVDATYRRAIEAGATQIREPSDQFYGDRSGSFYDPAGNMWAIGTHIEDVSHEEIQRRAEKWAEENAAS
jgi:uncharacterized glyoxalase superfamily protein PhnB